MMSKKLFSIIVTAALLISIFSLSAAAQSDDQTLVIGFEADVSSLDPGFADISVNERVNSLIYDGLVEYGENNKIVPGIAYDWDISDDGTVYTFYLQQGIPFHNGESLTAEDVKFTYDRILNPDNGSGLEVRLQSLTVLKLLMIIQ